MCHLICEASSWSKMKMSWYSAFGDYLRNRTVGVARRCMSSAHRYLQREALSYINPYSFYLNSSIQQTWPVLVDLFTGVRNGRIKMEISLNSWEVETAILRALLSKISFTPPNTVRQMGVSTILSTSALISPGATYLWAYTYKWLSNDEFTIGVRLW